MGVLRAVGFRLIFIALAAPPIVFAANYLRLLLWGLVDIYGKAELTGGLARGISAVCSLVAAYCLFDMVSSLEVHLFIYNEPECGECEPERTDE